MFRTLLFLMSDYELEFSDSDPRLLLLLFDVSDSLLLLAFLFRALLLAALAALASLLSLRAPLVCCPPFFELQGSAHAEASLRSLSWTTVVAAWYFLDSDRFRPLLVLPLFRADHRRRDVSRRRRGRRGGLNCKRRLSRFAQFSSFFLLA